MPAAAQSSVLLAMSAPPYWHCGRTVRRQSLMTLAALLPAVIGAVWTWGLPAVRVMSLCVAVAVLTEAACQKLMGRELAIDDYTAVCSGLLLSFMLPADAPWWIAVMAPLIAISLGKMAFGGLGANPVNTSVVGWAVLFVSFPLFMEPNAVQLNAASMVDPLVRLKFFGWADAGRIPLQDLLLGQQINGLGAGQVGALFLGGSLLAARGIIRWQIALGFFAGVAGLAALFYMNSPATDASPLFHLCTGSVMLGGFFLITDPANAPSRPLPMFLYGLLGGALVPVITARLNGVAPVVSASPALFAGAALFALITVLISCRRPGRMAGRVSPVEAVRYTEGRAPKPGARRRAKAVSLPAMALANLGRSRGKTALTMLSLALAVVLFWATTAFAGSFDMDKYTSYFTATDFILANAAHFQTGSEIFNPGQALPEEAIEAVNAAGGVADGARVYGRTSLVLEFVTDDYYRGLHGRWYTEEQLEAMLRSKGRNEAGRVEDTAQLYGMEPFALDQLTVLEGDLSKLNDPSANCIAAVYSEDDYGDLVADSHWAKLGDTVTLRYVEKLEYVDTNTGTAYSDLTEVPAGADLVERGVPGRGLHRGGAGGGAQRPGLRLLRRGRVRDGGRDLPAGHRH